MTTVAVGESEAEGLKERGNALFSKGKYLEALECYEAAISKFPDCAIYYSNASACCAKLDEFGQAALFAEEALRRDPSLTKAYFRKAVALMGLQQWRGALEDLRVVCRGMMGGEGGPSSDVTSRIQQCERELQKIAFAKAIHVDVFELDMKHIGALEVEDSYLGPRIADDEAISWDFVQQLMRWYYEEKRLHPHFLYRILFEAEKLLRACPNVVDLAVPVGGTLTICGDIHGQFFDLLHIFDINGAPSRQHTYLFNGDLVDRGPASLEVCILMMAMKAALPDNFFIARGNHESESVNRMHGFYEEVARKYPDDVRLFTIVNSVLNALPLVHVVEHKLFVVHGGLPMNASTLSLADLHAIDRYRTPEPASVMSQLLWSDPQDVPGISPSHRGEGILFGPDVTAGFLARNGLTHIIRSHVWEPTGYREQHDGKCITIFSAPDYTGSVSQGAVINLNASLDIKYRQYDAAPYRGKSPAPRLMPQFNGLFPN